MHLYSSQMCFFARVNLHFEHRHLLVFHACRPSLHLIFIYFNSNHATKDTYKTKAPRIPVHQLKAGYRNHTPGLHRTLVIKHMTSTLDQEAPLLTRLLTLLLFNKNLTRLDRIKRTERPLRTKPGICPDSTPYVESG